MPQRSNSPLPEAGMSLPSQDTPKQTQQPVVPLTVEQLAKVAKHKNFSEIHRRFEEKRDWYTKNLPDGTPVSAATAKQRAEAWNTAVVVISELDEMEAIIAKALEIVSDAKKTASQ